MLHLPLELRNFVESVSDSEKKLAFSIISSLKLATNTLNSPQSEYGSLEELEKYTTAMSQAKTKIDRLTSAPLKVFLNSLYSTLDSARNC